MKMLRLVLILALTFLIINQGSVFAAEPTDEQSQGVKLVNQLWSDLKEGNIEAIEEYIVPGFQSIHEDGARDRDAEIELIKGLDLGDYTLTDLKVTQNGPVIIVTYFVSVEETIGDKRLSTKPAARLSAWLKSNNEWQWIIHANLKALQ
jgi:hypothetical protein